MFGGNILAAIQENQLSIGNQMGTDARSSELVSGMTVGLANAWMGPSQVTPTTDPKGYHGITMNDLFYGYYYQDANGKWLERPKTMVNDGSYMPETGTFFFTTEEIQAAVQGIAAQEAGTSDPNELEKLEAARQTWSSLSSSMSNLKDSQTSPLTTLAQGESSAIQQDQSAVSGSSSLGQILANLDGISANLVPNIS